jgi:site-specific DNA recombinase
MDQLAWRLPAGDVETITREGLAAFFGDPARVMAELGAYGVPGNNQCDGCSSLVDAIAVAAGFAHMLQQLDVAVSMSEGAAEIALSRAALARLTCCPCDGSDIDAHVRIEVAVTLKRRGHEMRLAYAAPMRDPVPVTRASFN